MTDKKFNAILAKNEIARELKEGENGGMAGEVVISRGFVLACLRDIEAYLGQANQPTVDEIIDSDMKI